MGVCLRGKRTQGQSRKEGKEERRKAEKRAKQEYFLQNLAFKPILNHVN